MTALTADDILTVLRLQATRGIGVRTLGRILDDCIRRESSPAELIRLEVDEFATRYQLARELAHEFQTSAELVEPLWRELRDRSIHVLMRGWPAYPQQLLVAMGGDAPPVLFAMGNTQLLTRPAVGFCGSRKASDRGLAITQECAHFMASGGMNVVSGYAHGVDLAAHRAALEAGGTTTLVLAEGILHFRVKTALQDLADESNSVAVSEFAPSIPWSGRNAMARNRTICGLSSVMILVEAGAAGGTFECGKAALEQKCPLFVVEYAQPPDSAVGNAFFLNHGARALRRSAAGDASMDAVIAAASAPVSERWGGEEAKTLF
jgi:DNA protecting protein DprA